MKLTDVVSDKVSESGVQPITVGHVVSAQVREGLRAILKQYDEEGYAQYRAIKYPEGEGSDTPETRVAATRFLFDRSRDLMATYYLSTKE